MFGIQHAFDYLTDVDWLYNEYTPGFFSAAQSFFPAGPYPVGPEPFAISFQDSNEADDWYDFRWALFNTAARNVVYFGHGGPNGLEPV